MASYVYLFRNGDLYIIGMTKNLERTKQLLIPGQLMASLRSEAPEVVFERIKNLYKDQRLPGSDYYRLSPSQANDCKKQLKQVDGFNFSQPFFIGPRLYLTFIFSWILITFLIIKFGVDPVFSKFL